MYFCIEMKKNLPPFSVVIPAAGYSDRMGMPKLLLPFGHHTFCEEIFMRYHLAGARKIVFVINQPLLSPCLKLFPNHTNKPDFIINKTPLMGRYKSIMIGLSCIPDNLPCFLQNSDNPLVNESVLIKLLSESNPDYTAIPVFKNRNGHPVLIGTNIIKNLLKCTMPDANLRIELQKYNTKKIEVSTADILLNINTPEDYKEIFGRNISK